MSSPFVKLFSKNLYSLYNGDFDEKTGEPMRVILNGEHASR